MTAAPRISSALFDLVDEYAPKLASGEARPAGTLTRSSAPLTFCENLFNQFFVAEYAVQITGFGGSVKRQAVDLRLTHRTKPPAARKMVAQFERFCDFFPDILGAGYGGSIMSWRRFHLRFLPGLLASVHDWADAVGDEVVRDRAHRTMETYAAAINSASL